MKHLIIALAAAAAIVTLVKPAVAQYYGAEVDIISPREATEVVRAAGFDPVSRPLWRPGRYIVHAVDRYGRELRVVVDARLGEIVRAAPLGAYADVGPRSYDPYPHPQPYGRPTYPPADMSAPDEEFDGADAPPPPDANPHVIPGPRSAAPQPSRSAALPPKAAAPKQAPLPRSRPAETATTDAKPDAKDAVKAETTPQVSKDIRQIDLSKPKTAEAPKAVDVPKAAEPAPASTPDVKALDDATAKPRF